MIHPHAPVSTAGAKARAIARGLLLSVLLLLPLAPIGAQVSDTLRAQLLEAARVGNEPEAVRLVRAGADPELRTSDGWSALYFAARDDRRDLMEALLERGARVDSADDRWTPLTLAAYNGNAFPIAMLLRAHVAGSEVARARAIASAQRAKLAGDSTGLPDSTARRTRARLAQLDVALQVLTDSARGGELLLVRAAARNDVARLDSLLREGVSPGARDPGGWTALHYASRDGREGIVAELLARGASPATADSAGRTPLFLASFNGNTACALRLVAALGWNPALARRGAETATERARAEPDSARKQQLVRAAGMLGEVNRGSGAVLARAVADGATDVVATLVALGVRPGAREAASEFLSAATHGSDSTIALLLRSGVSLGVRDSSGATPLHLAARRGDATAALALYLRGADLDATDREGRTAVQVAAGVGESHVARLLRGLDTTLMPVRLDTTTRRAGADSTLPSIALEYAIAAGAGELTVELLRLGLSPNERLRALAGIARQRTPLMLAIDSGRTDIAARLVDAGADLYARDADGNTALRVAATSGHLDIAPLLLRRMMDLEARDPERRTDLVWAAREGQDSLGLLLIAAGATLDADEEGWTPLHHAAAWGANRLLDGLLANGSTPAARTSAGLTPLVLAIRNGNYYATLSLIDAMRNDRAALAEGRDTVVAHLARIEDSLGIATAADVRRDLMRRRADLVAMRKVLDVPSTVRAALLVEAAWQGYTARVRALLAAGVAPDAPGGSAPALLLAAQRGRDSAAFLLLRAGASVSSATTNGWTALHYAARDHRRELLDSLLAHGADPALSKSDGWTPLALAAWNDDAYAVAAMLYLAPRARTALPGALGRVRELAASLTDSLAATTDTATATRLRGRVEEMRRMEATLEAPDRSGEFLLAESAWLGKADRVRALLARGVPADARSRYGRPALALAIEQGRDSVALMLLAAGADPRAATAEGWTVLHDAAFRGLTRVTAELVRRGASATALDAAGDSPLVVAALNGHADVVGVLAADERARQLADSIIRAKGDLDRLKVTEAVSAALARRAPRWQPARDTASLAFFEATRIGLPSLVMQGFEATPLRAEVLGAMARRLPRADVRRDDDWTPLMIASLLDQSAVVDALLRAGADFRLPVNESGLQPLHFAVAGGSCDVTRALLRAGADPNAATPGGWTSMISAGEGSSTTSGMTSLDESGGARWERNVVNGACTHEALALLVFGAGGDPRHADARGVSAIDAARSSGAKDLATLLEQGRLDAALDNAIALGVREQVDSLLAHGVRPRPSSLSFAIIAPVDSTERHGLVRRLLRAGADVHAADSLDARGRQPLHYAAGYPDAAMVDELLRAGAVIDVRDSTGMTPLMLAVPWKDSMITQRLLAAGADVNAHSRDGDTPLLEAITYGDSATVAMLLSRGAHAEDVRDSDGTTPLMAAARSGRRDVLTLLLKAGARADRRDRDGRTALHQAANAGDSAIINLLLRAHVPANVAANDGETPLLSAVHGAGASVRDERLAVVDALLRAGANANRVDSAGYTALELAAANGSASLAMLLLDHGADPFRGPRSAIRLAADSAHDVALAVLWCGATRRPDDIALPAMPDSVAAVLATAREAGLCTSAGARRIADAATTLALATERLGSGDLNAAVAAAAAADSIYARAFPLQHPRRIEAMLTHARALYAAGRYDAANTVLTGLEDLRRRANSDDRSLLSEIDALGGDIAVELGRPGMALTYYEFARRATADETSRPSTHGESTELDRGLRGMVREAHLDAMIGDVDAARQVSEAALERLHTDFAAEIAVRFYMTYGEIQLRNGEPLDAARLFRAAAAAAPRRPIEPITQLDAGVAEGRALRLAGDTAQARRRLASVIAAARTERGATHPLVGSALFELAQLERDSGDAVVAGALLDRAAHTAAPGRANLVQLAAERRLADVDSGSTVRELDAVFAASALTTRLTFQLGLFSAAAQRAYVSEVFPQIRDALLSMHDPFAMRMGYRTLRQWKGMLVHLLGQHGTGAGSDVARARLADARARLAAWVLRQGEVPDAQWKARYAALSAEKEALEAEMGLSSDVEVAQLDVMADGGLERALGRRGVLVDIYRHQRGAQGRAIYSAFVLTGDSTLQLVRLGDADSVETAVGVWRAAVASGSLARDEWERLRALVWAPIRRALPDSATSLWIAPDGVLSIVPWQLAAAEVASHVAVVPSPRQVVTVSRDETPAGRERALIVGAVDFDAGTQPGEAGTPFPKLPGTATEADSVAARGRAHHLALTVLEGRAATKRAVLTALPAATWVHVATHGFFGGSTIQQSGSRGVEDVLIPDATVASRNPLLESGLAFAGANVSASRSRGAGILTAEELVGLDLSHTRLVVLSACETALGSQVDGQGVQGLQAALLASGAQGLLMSLWKVPDASTALLMTSFYDGLWRRGLPPADALRAAQERVRADPRYRAPLYWAGWVLVGRVW